MPEAELTTLVVDDHPVVRKGLVALLEGEPWAGRCVQAESVASAKAVAVAERPRLAVVDLRLPDGCPANWHCRPALGWRCCSSGSTTSTCSSTVG